MADAPESPQRFRARKAPAQNRSRSTVEAIKQAAMELVAESGFSQASTSTTRIAERAGVSVGSLYQYFPTREAILLALFEDASALMTRTMKQVMLKVWAKPLADGVREVMKRLLALHREHEAVVLKMVVQIPELKLATQPISFENMIFDAIRMYVDHWTPGLSAIDLDRRAFFLREIILGSIQRYLLERPDNLPERRFIDDLSTIVMHYIALPAAATPARAARRG